MTAIQFRSALERLGASQTAIAGFLGISDRQARRYAAGDAEIPRTVAIILRLLVAGKLAAADLTAVTERNPSTSHPVS